MKASPAMTIWALRSVRRAAHGSQPTFKPAVVGLNSVVAYLLDVVPRRRQQIVEHSRVDRGGVGSPGEWRAKRAASANSGVNRCTHR
jgi:hypothetical protein